MKTFCRVCFLWVCVVGYSFAIASAQDFNADYIKCFSFYSRSHLSIDLNVKQFGSKDDEYGKSVGIGKIRKRDNSYYSSFGGRETIINERGQFIIDHENISIDVFAPTPQKRTDLASMMQGMDLVKQHYDSVNYKGVTQGMKKYTAYTSSGIIQRTDFYFNKLQGYLQKIVYYYPPDNKSDSYGTYKVEITYERVSEEPVSMNWFSENKFLSSVNARYVLNEKYAGYKLTFAN